MQEKMRLEQHTPIQSILLHLLPGLLITAGYFALHSLVQRAGYPSVMALIIPGVLVLIPVQLGYLLVQGKRINGSYSLKGVISYRQSIPTWEYFVWVPLLFVAAGLIFTVFKPLDAFLHQNVFSAWPLFQTGLEGGYDRAVLVKTYFLFVVFVTVLGPTVEELYFRGYLLPRMGYAGKWAPLLHSFLFAVYHFFTPWFVITRTLAMLPLIYAVQRKNIYLSIITHVLLNSIDVIVAVGFIASMG
jgi:CAAX protease family protein